MGFVSLPDLPKDKTSANADGHTHGDDRNVISLIGGDNEPSTEDVESTREDAKKYNGYTSFVGTPNGTLWKIEPWVSGQPKPEKGSAVKAIDTNMPSDPNSSTRQNEISLEITPVIIPII